ncbi:MAG: IS481 family transposase [Dehalococcoidia bacterium]|nr:IS481 family transposase [Dehalococcoidia bacterium]
MHHSNARLTVWARGEVVRQVMAGLTQAEIARQFRVSRATIAKWMRRYREEGAAGLQDRSCRPHSSPRQVSPALVSRIRGLRIATSWGPHRIAWTLRLARSTVYAVLRRLGLHRLAWLHRTTREVIRYEKKHPGELIHLDVKKLARIPPGGGKRMSPYFIQTGMGPSSSRGLGYDYVHVAIDDNSRYAYAEALPDEKGVTTAAFLERVLAHFAQRGIHSQRLLTDNGGNYISRAFQQVAVDHGIRLNRTRPYRPQTNGKAEAFIKILQNEWAYIRPYNSNRHRLDLLPTFLEYYNYQRPHGGIGGLAPTSRL